MGSFERMANLTIATAAVRKQNTAQTAEVFRKELNRLQRALVRETDQAKCDAMEQRICELEAAPHGEGSPKRTGRT